MLGAEIALVEREERIARLHLIPNLHMDLGNGTRRGRTEERILRGGLDEPSRGDEAVLIAGSWLIRWRLDWRLIGRAAGELQGGDGAGKGEHEEQDAFLEHKGD